jgi:Ca2+-binding EF-hand superfamily protein
LGEKLIQKDDGTFWMSFDDVVLNFFSLNVCFVRHKAYCAQPWKEQRRKFFFDYQRIEKQQDDGENDNGGDTAQSTFGEENWSNPFRISCPLYTLAVQEKGQFVLSIHQQDIRCEGSPTYIDMGLAVMRIDPQFHTFRLVCGTGNTCERQNMTNEIELEPGKYLVVPFTSGAKLHSEIDTWMSAEQQRQQQVQTQTQSQIQTPTQTGSKKHRIALLRRDISSGEMKFTEAVINAYQVLFTRLDADCDGVLNKTELDQYMLRTEGSTIEDSAFVWLLHNFESKDAEGLSVTGFINAQLFVFRSTGSDEEKLWQEFRTLGYDDTLQLRTGRSATLAVHGTSAFSIANIPCDEEAMLEAQELVIMEYGELQSFDEQRIHLYAHRSGYHGVSLLVENCHHLPLIFSVDCGESENVVSHRGQLTHTEVVPPNQRVIFHHLIPKDTSKAWTWAYSASFLWDEDLDSNSEELQQQLQQQKPDSVEAE